MDKYFAHTLSQGFKKKIASENYHKFAFRQASKVPLIAINHNFV